MDTNDTEFQTIDFNKAKVVSTYKNLNRLISDNNDVISRLTRKLQTTLNTSDIVHMFAKELKALVDYKQLKFSVDNKSIITIGDQSGPHSCQYNLTIDDTDLGSISFSRKKRFMEEELAIIERLASTLVFPLRNAKLYHSALQSALRDDLTGFGNKRALDAGLHREAELSVRHKTPLSILMLDVDHFKRINDTMGHIAGDKILKDLAATIKKSARQSDLCFRYGGEEFMVILDDTDAVQSINIAERVRLSVEQYTYNYKGKIIPVTISLGTATYEKNETLESFKDRADQALYKAKGQGRNIVVSSELDIIDSHVRPIAHRI